MPAAIPLALRQRIVAAHEEGEKAPALAERFKVGLASVERFLKRHREGCLAPSPHGGGRQRSVSAAQEPLLRQLVQRTPDATKAELCRAFEAHAGEALTPSSLGRALKRLGVTRKKSPSRRRRSSRSASRS